MMPEDVYNGGNKDLKPHLGRLCFILYLFCRKADTAAHLERSLGREVVIRGGK